MASCSSQMTPTKNSTLITSKNPHFSNTKVPSTKTSFRRRKSPWLFTSSQIERETHPGSQKRLEAAMNRLINAFTHQQLK
jgi:hypothetical protein